MFSESRNDRHQAIANRAATNRLRDRNNSAGISNNFAEICDDAAGIVDNATKVIPC